VSEQYRAIVWSYRIGALGPDERLWVVIMRVDEGSDVGVELIDGAMDAALDLLVGEQREPALDLVKPGGAGRCEVEVIARWRTSHELLSRPMRDRRAVTRYAGLTGSPDESGARRREQGLAGAGNAQVRRGMIQLAWRFLMFQKESALALWYRARTADSVLARATQ
jgi:hypothetical protein